MGRNIEVLLDNFNLIPVDYDPFARGRAEGGAVDRLPDSYASQNIEDRRNEHTVRGRRLEAIQAQADAADTRQVLRSMKQMAEAR